MFSTTTATKECLGFVNGHIFYQVYRFTSNLSTDEMGISLSLFTPPIT